MDPAHADQASAPPSTDGKVDPNNVVVVVNGANEPQAKQAKPQLTLLKPPLLHADSAGDSRFEMSKSGVHNVTASAQEMKRSLLDEYFRCSSQPFDLKNLLDVVTHGVVYESPTDTCEGKRGFFAYHKDLFEKIDQWKRNLTMSIVTVEQQGAVSVAKWKCTYTSGMLCGRRRTVEGTTEFEFEEFQPHGIESASPMVPMESPRDAQPRRYSASQPAAHPPPQNRQGSFPVVATYRISRIRVDAVFNPTCFGIT